jgi:hypothetical protein
MNQRKTLVDFLGMAVGIFVILIFFDWLKLKFHFNSHTFIEDALWATAGAFGWVGFEELDRGGHTSARKLFRKCLLVWLVISFILILPSVYFKIDYVFRYSLYLFGVLFAAPFPVALYLNRNQNKSRSQPTTDNAS